MFTKLILLLAVPTLILGQLQECKKYTSCDQCMGKKDFLGLSCGWCMNGNKCDVLDAGCSDKNTINDVYDCPIPVPKGFEYTDDFGRNKVLPLIGATNGENDDQVKTCLVNHFPGAILYKTYTVKCDGRLGKDDVTCFAYLAVSKDDKAVILAFRGTQGALQLVTEGKDFLFDDISDFPLVGGKVDKYFSDAFNSLWIDGGLEAGLKSLRTTFPLYELWIVGHSLGGSLASMVSPLVIKNGLYQAERVKMMTFGEPRTGDEVFAKAHDSYVKYTYRIVHNKDSVPHLPWQIENLDDPPMHHRYEIWYPNKMTQGSSFKVCLRADDDSCSNTVPFDQQTPDDHNNYFGVDLTTWYKSGCK